MTTKYRKTFSRQGRAVCSLASTLVLVAAATGCSIEEPLMVEDVVPDDVVELPAPDEPPAMVTVEAGRSAVDSKPASQLGADDAQAGDVDAGQAKIGQDKAPDPVSLVSISLTPTAPVMDAGTTQALVATGLYSDGSTEDLTDSVSWTTSRSIFATTEGGLSLSTDGGKSFTNKNASVNGLAHDWAYGIFVDKTKIYVCTESGLSVSTDGGNSFTTLTAAANPNMNKSDLERQNRIWSVWANGQQLYVGSDGGLSVSIDGGNSFTYQTQAEGLSSNTVGGINVVENTLYASTYMGLSTSFDAAQTWSTTKFGKKQSVVWDIFVDGLDMYASTSSGLFIKRAGETEFTRKGKNKGLGANFVTSSYALGTTIYVATDGGLSISPDSGTSWVNKTMAEGLGNNSVQDVVVVGAPDSPAEHLVYATTYGGGIAISEDGGNSFVSKTMDDGLGSNETNNIFVCENCGNATVSNDVGEEGLLTAAGPGATTVIATLGELRAEANLIIH